LGIVVDQPFFLMTLITSIVGLKFESLVVGLSLMLFSNLGVGTITVKCGKQSFKNLIEFYSDSK
jgi:hypothetical protein